MNRMFTMSDLSRRWAISPTSAFRWKQAGKLPSPDGETANGQLLWSEKTIEAFEKATPNLVEMRKKALIDSGVSESRAKFIVGLKMPGNSKPKM